MAMGYDVPSGRLTPETKVTTLRGYPSFDYTLALIESLYLRRLERDRIATELAWEEADRWGGFV